MFPGFGLVVYPEGTGSATAGQKEYFVEFQADGKSHQITIGRVGQITVEQARELANMIQAWAKLGEDLELLRKTAEQVIVTLVDCPYRNKIRFRKMVVLELTKLKAAES